MREPAKEGGRCRPSDPAKGPAQPSDTFGNQNQEVEMATTAVKNQQQTNPNLAGMATALILAAVCAGLFLLAPSPSVAASDAARLHPGHQGHLASGKEYPGVPATQYHTVAPFEEGPGGWAEEKSGGANDQRAVEFPQ
jgi:hypothetical protein